MKKLCQNRMFSKQNLYYAHKQRKEEKAVTEL
jgi:hypothetical protein